MQALPVDIGFDMGGGRFLDTKVAACNNAYMFLYYPVVRDYFPMIWLPGIINSIIVRLSRCGAFVYITLPILI